MCICNKWTRCDVEWRLQTPTITHSPTQPEIIHTRSTLFCCVWISVTRVNREASIIVSSVTGISMGGVSVAGSWSFAHREECKDATEAQENLGFGRGLAWEGVGVAIEAGACLLYWDRKGSLLLEV